MTTYLNHGINTKTFSIPLTTGKRTYSLGTVIKQSDFDRAEAIVGISFRKTISSFIIAYKDEDGNILASSTIVSSSWLDLYAKDGTKLLCNHNLDSLTTDQVVRDSYGLLFPPTKAIGWNASTINISTGRDIVINPVNSNPPTLEFTVFYTTECAKHYAPNVAFNTGQFNALRKQTVEVVATGFANTGKAFFKFGNNELPECAQIVGVRFPRSGFQNKDGLNSVRGPAATSISPTNKGAMGLSFLNLQTRNSGYHVLLDNMPLSDIKAILHIGKDYFPIELTESSHIDWNKSGFLVADTSLLNDNAVFSLVFYYYL